MEIEESLVKKAVQGDEEAFEKIYGCIYKDMYKYAYYMLGNPHDAEDVVSEAVIDIYLGMNKLRNIGSFRAWAFKILSNKCRRKRKQYLKKEVSIEDNQMEQFYEERDMEQAQVILNAFEMLSFSEKNIISLAVFGGYKSSEIGDILNMKSGTVRSKLSRALGKMQKILEV